MTVFSVGLQLLEHARTILDAIQLLGSVRHGFTYIAIPRTKRAHRNDLRRQLREMPFIYKEMGVQLLTEYVPAALRVVDLLMLDVPRGRELATPSLKEKETAAFQLKFTPRALILADPGMGKTTFLSYVALRLCEWRDESVAHFAPRGPVLPIFVPLRVLDNAVPQPVLLYILSTPYFRGRTGMRRLAKLAWKGSLFIVLDGYDEVYLPVDGAQSTIIADINSLLLGAAPQEPGFSIDADYVDFYRSLRHNRVWISSRKEFYIANRLTADLDATRAGNPPEIAAIELSGLENRTRLVRNIFDRYRRRSHSLRELLSEDAFFAWLQRSVDEEVTRLSSNPLFLTIACYLYVKRVEAAGSLDVTPESSARALVVTCVMLLLSDLDEHRVRSLPARLRWAFRQRRGMYPTEKMEFLGYFAAELLGATHLATRAAFTKKDLENVATQFFSSVDTSDHSAELLDGIREGGVASLTEQLILQGLFVRVDSSSEDIFYDFPHRRFREILAANYLERPDRIGSFFEHLLEPHYREFVLVMFATTVNYAPRILERLLECAENAETSSYSLELAATCIGARAGFDASDIVEAWLRRVADSRHIDIAPQSLLKSFRPSAAFVTWAHNRLVVAVSSEDRWQIQFFGSILYAVSGQLLRTLIFELLQRPESQRLAAIELTRVLIHTGGDDFIALSREVQDRHGVSILAESAVGCRGVTGREPWWRAMCSECTDERLVLVMRVAKAVNPRLMPRVLGFERLDALPRREIKDDASVVYVFNHRDVTNLSNHRGREVLLRVPEGLYFDLAFIPGMPLPRFEDVARELFVAEQRREKQWLEKERFRKTRQEDLKNIDRALGAIGSKSFVEFCHREGAAIQKERETIRERVKEEVFAFVKARMGWGATRWAAFWQRVESEN